MPFLPELDVLEGVLPSDIRVLIWLDETNVPTFIQINATPHYHETQTASATIQITINATGDAVEI
jgi:hypothetical protein